MTVIQTKILIAIMVSVSAIAVMVARESMAHQQERAKIQQIEAERSQPLTDQQNAAINILRSGRHATRVSIH